MSDSHVICRTGIFADGKATPSYQVFKRFGDWTIVYYEAVSGLLSLSDAREMLDRLTKEKSQVVLTVDNDRAVRVDIGSESSFFYLDDEDSIESSTRKIADFVEEILLRR